MNHLVGTRDSTPMAVGRAIGKWRAFLAAAVFAGLYIVVLVHGPRFAPSLGTTTSALIIALVLTLPLVLSPALGYFAARISGVKIPDVLEISLTTLETDRSSLRGLAERLRMATEQVSA